MFFSAQTCGFYDDPQNYPNPPSDLVEVSPELYAQVMQNRPAGMIVVAGEDGLPTLKPANPPTYENALDSLNAVYQADVDRLNRAFALAYLSDGPSQEAKQAAIRDEYAARKAAHAQDIANLKNQYEIQA